MKNCSRRFTGSIVAAMLVFGMTSCNVGLLHEHTYSEEWTSDETYHWHAATCSHTDEVADKAEHSWDKGTITKKSTYTEEGEKTYTCTVCLETKTEALSKLKCSHVWDAGTITTPATCTTAGVRTYTCSVCKETKTEEIAAAHTWNKGEITTAPTCTTAGVRTYTCSVCNETKTEEIAARHTYSDDWTSNETYHWHAATCEHTSEVKGKEAHSWDEGVITTPATCSKAGIKTYTCSICNATKTEKVEKIAHTEGSGTVKTPAACLTTGVMEYYCTVCNELIREEEIPATGHNFSTEWTTDESDETHHWHICTNAGCTVISDITEHTEDSGTVTTPATCVTKGVKTFSCAYCGKFLRVEEIAELYSSPIDKDTELAATSSSTYVYFGVFPKSVLASDSDVTIDKETAVTMGGKTYYKGSDGEYYAEVKENGYESTYTYSDNSAIKQKSDDSTRYFKVEPILWKIRSISGGNALLVAEEIITAGYYNCTNGEWYKTDSTRMYPSNYKYSTIREYLNGYHEEENNYEDCYSNKGLLQTAFTTAAQELICTTTVDNSKESTQKEINSTTAATIYICDNTQDKIFLLSVRETTLRSYGFKEYYYEGTESDRVRIPTDYAKANYAYQDADSNGGKWWLRSPDDRDEAHTIASSGYGSASEEILNKFVGVVPAMQITLE